MRHCSRTCGTPNQITPANAGIALRFHVQHRWPGVTEFYRWAITVSRNPPFRVAVDSIVAPWASKHGFARASAYVWTRPSRVVDAFEVIELQKSCKHPHRTFTVNLGFFHRGYTASPPPVPEKVDSAYCARRVRIGPLMPKSGWRRWSIWLRFGSGWHFWELFGGDFWWSYRESDSSVSSAIHHAICQVEQYGFTWLKRSGNVHSASELFDRARFSTYESAGFYP
jgi:hypothetical protein